MFSVGNIAEKLRIASFDCRGEVVVDLYAGAINSAGIINTRKWIFFHFGIMKAQL